MLRKGERTEETIVEDLARRVKILEQVATRRVLPPNYEFIVDDAGTLLIKRVSDGATVILL